MNGASSEENKEWSYIFSGTFLTDFVVSHDKICVFIMICAVNMVYFVWRRHVRRMIGTTKIWKQ